MSDVVEEIGIETWSGPFPAALRTAAQDALEHGKVLLFPRLAFVLNETEKPFLTAGVADGKAKNISLDPTSGKIQGTALKGAEAEKLAAMIERFGAGATQLVRELLPNYACVERARTSYRPVQVKGRAYSVISDDRLLHVDAFPSRPMRGRRILRFFANVAPQGARRWQVGEAFEDFARAFLPRVQGRVPGKSWVFEKLGVTRGRRSRYDEIMLALHDAAKRDARYQRDAPHQTIDFPPGCCWLVYTDQVLHAALGGEFALEQTFHFDVAAMGDPARAPLKVLERLGARTLV
jgi:hypothetical protein